MSVEGLVNAGKPDALMEMSNTGKLPDWSHISTQSHMLGGTIQRDCESRPSRPPSRMERVNDTEFRKAKQLHDSRKADKFRSQLNFGAPFK